MRIVFADFLDWDYNVETPYQRPLGGTQSAACYLAEALAKAGETVFLANHTQAPGVVRGVNCISLHQFDPGKLGTLGADVLVTVMSAGNARGLRGVVGQRTKIILWTGHGPPQPDVRYLRDPSERDSYDAFAF